MRFSLLGQIANEDGTFKKFTKEQKKTMEDIGEVLS